MIKNKSGNGDSQVPNIIAQGTSIVGDFISEGDFRIEGTINGTIKTKGRIVVGQSGNVDGEITCSDADICGNVKGKLIVNNLAILKATAIFSGDITTKRISIESGAVFSGNCSMTATKTEKEKK